MAAQVSYKKGSVRLEGEVTIYSATEVSARLFSTLTKYKAVLLDLSAVSELDTAGLQLLLAARRFSGEAGRTLKLRSPSPVVEDVLQLCRLSIPSDTAGAGRPAKKAAP